MVIAPLCCVLLECSLERYHRWLSSMGQKSQTVHASSHQRAGSHSAGSRHLLHTSYMLYVRFTHRTSLGNHRGTNLESRWPSDPDHSACTRGGAVVRLRDELFAFAMSSVLYGRINSQLSSLPAKRSVALVLATILPQSTTEWVPLLLFKTVEALRITKGYPCVLANSLCLIVLAQIINVYVNNGMR